MQTKISNLKLFTMKRIFFAIMAIASLAVLASCSGSSVDPIHETVPVDSTFRSYFPLDEFHRLGNINDTVGQRAMVDQYRKILTANVVNHYPNIKDEKNIKFVLGSGFAKDVMSGDGKTYSGQFKNELIIIVDDETVKDTVFLACGNGMLSPLNLSDSHDFGTAEQWRFTIKKGEGLANYIPQLEEWGKVATNLKIPIKNKDGKVVSQKTYLNYLGKYESLLFEGDIIDLLDGKVYNKAGQEVQFDRRQAETRKANAKAKSKKNGR